MNNEWELLNTDKIGIVGCGHLGEAVAKALVGGGLKKENLLISHRGNPQTYQKLEAQGLASCLAKNERVFSEAKIVLLTVKPQDIPSLKESALSSRALIASCAAGVPLETLEEIFGENVLRIMLSGPDTVADGRGVAAMYPENEALKRLFCLMGLNLIKIRAEHDLDVFTAGVCLTAALLKTESPSEEGRAIEKIGLEYPLLKQLYVWAKDALPEFENKTAKEEYIAKMATKGGVTDAIITSLERGAPLEEALKRGIARTEEISLEIKNSLAAGKSRAT
ncbi:MAG: hypothetical protein EOM51_01980 [Clostridia bacterium]|nr:hypothetical protein [Clostridia bacterium]